MNKVKAKDPIMDFRMDNSGWITIIAMILLFAFMFIPDQIGQSWEIVDILKNLGLGTILTFFLVSLACIPVVIYCWFADEVPDIDYSVIVAAIICIISMIAYFLI